MKKKMQQQVKSRKVLKYLSTVFLLMQTFR